MPNLYLNEVDKFLGQEFVEVVMVHRHSPTCRHPRVIHGDHVDYLVNGRLHFPHGMHCDDHGPFVIFNGNGGLIEI